MVPRTSFVVRRAGATDGTAQWGGAALENTDLAVFVRSLSPNKPSTRFFFFFFFFFFLLALMGWLVATDRWGVHSRTLEPYAIEPPSQTPGTNGSLLRGPTAYPTQHDGLRRRILSSSIHQKRILEYCHIHHL
jgi:hypothetical protein